MMGTLGFVVESGGPGFRPDTRNGLGRGREISLSAWAATQLLAALTMARGMDAGNQLDNSRAT